MKAESDPITEDELLLRRVRIEKFCTNEVPLISPNAFEPRIQGRDPDIRLVMLKLAEEASKDENIVRRPAGV